MKAVPAVLVIMVAVALSGCGFRPLYGETGPSAQTASELESIAVATPNSLIGVQLKNYLIDTLSPKGEPSAPRYRLEVAVSGRREEVAVRLDASATRYNFELAASFKLIDTETGDTVYRDGSVSTVPYDVVDSQFATVYSRFDAESRTAQDLSEKIRLRLALFFDNRATKTAQANVGEDL